MVKRKSVKFSVVLLFLFVSGILCVTGCTSSKHSSKNQTPEEIENNDPFEEVNRAIFKFNLVLDDYVLEPATTVYNEVVPKLVQRGIANELTTLKQPLNTVNYAIAGEEGNAARSMMRFFTNLFIGFFGLVDVYKELELKNPPPDRNLGDTLANKGVRSGPYLMLPILGPSSPRDVTGLVFDLFADPVYYIPKSKNRVYYGSGRYLLNQLNSRAEMLEAYKQTKKQSLDLYSTLRSIYWQKKRGDKQPSAENSPSPYDDDD